MGIFTSKPDYSKIRTKKVREEEEKKEQKKQSKAKKWIWFIIVLACYLAFCYWKEGDDNSAASYCKEALARYDRLSPSDREAQGGGTIDMLRELDRILN